MELTNRINGIHPSLTLAITAKAQKMKSEGIPVVSFGAGEPDFNTPEYIREAGKAAIDGGFTKYTPTSGLMSLKSAICRKLKRDNALDYSEENIVVSGGAKHALTNVLLALVQEGDEVIIPAPYWLTYPELVTFCGGKPVIVETLAENGFKITPEQLSRAVTPKTKAFVFNNPNNPTGAVYTEEEVKALAAVLDKTDVCVIADEIYEKLAYEDKCYSMAAYNRHLFENTVTLNGVSKTYAMTGWRIGFVACTAALAKAVTAMQSQMTSNTCSVAQMAAYAAYDDERGSAFVSEMRNSFDERRKLICAKLDEIGAHYVKPYGAFYVMVDVSGYFGKSYEGQKIDGALGFSQLLLDDKAVAVIPCEPFGAPGYVRLSYAAGPKDIVTGIERMGEFMSRIV